MLAVGLDLWTRSRAGGGALPAVGGAALLTSPTLETDGLGVDFTYATDAGRVAVKTASVVVASGLDGFFTNATTSPKQVFDVSGAVIWPAHNLFVNSAAPVTSTNVTTIIGETYTVTLVGSGSMTASVGGTGVATAASPLTFVATGVSTTLTKAGTVTQAQMNRGATATTYLVAGASVRIGCSVDYDPVSHASLGLLNDLTATNLLLNNAVLSTQSVTVTAVTHTLSFYGTGTITCSGVSTTVLNGTGANDRVTQSFLPTAGSLTLTVTGTVTRAQLEIGVVASSVIPTWGATQPRAADNYTFLLSTIPSIGSEYSFYCRFQTQVVGSTRFIAVFTDGTTNEFAGFRSSTSVAFAATDGGVAVGSISQGTIVANTNISFAGRIKLNDCALSVAGAAPVFDTTVTLPTVTEMRFGNTGGNAAAVAQYRLQKLVVVPRAWSDAELALRSAT